MAGFFTRKGDFTIPSGGISAVETISLGGIEQTILVQGENRQNPVLLFVHGGPSMPTPGVSARGRDYTITTNTKELVKHFMVVFWDQRGTGRSYHKDIPKESMRIQQFVTDANELTDYLRSRFNKEKIFLVAHSWGSTIGLDLASRYPEKFYSYTGLSQIVSWTENDLHTLNYLKAEATLRGNKKALKELESVGKPPYLESPEQWSLIRKWQMKFKTLIYQDEFIKHPGLMGVTLDILKSPDYRLKDVYNTFIKGFQLVYTQSFIEDLALNNFRESVKEISIPVTFIHGRKDFHVNASPVQSYFEELTAPMGKKFIWANKSAHAFHPDDTKINEQHLIEQTKYVH
ncbi:alpha/beta hydrolase [Bacillus sp. CGMCC 1.16607]|uniref:alpha/beta hydrolase n=1 Tax=Bacillus sp. CGMCC 1.16607 TaxID=3351842 RepID=UPI00363B9274